MRSRRVVLLTLALVLGLLSALAFAGCSERSERTDVVSSRVVLTSDTARIPPLLTAPSAAVTVDSIVVGYTDLSRVASGGSPMGWAVGHDTTSPDGGLQLQFAKCNADDPWCSSGTPMPCNGQTGGVCRAPGQRAWMGTASLVADARGNVVYVTLGDGDGDTSNGAELVVATLSLDGGATFGNAPSASVVVNTAGCGTGIQDLPDATFDFTTEPATLWVVWRHKGASSFGGCVNHGVVDVVNQTIRMSAPRPVGGMDREFFGNIDAGQGGLRVQAGDGAVSVAFSNNDKLEKCPKPTHMQWGTVTSFDYGANWSSHSIVHHTNRFPSCVLGGRVTNTLRAFDFVRAPDGNYYMAVQDDGDSVRLFYSANLGLRVPTMPFEKTGPEVWRELCSRKQPKASGEPFTRWTDPGEPCPWAAVRTIVGKSLLYPRLAADGNGRLSLLYYESTKNDDALVPTYRGFVAPRSPNPTMDRNLLSFAMSPVVTEPKAGTITFYLTMVARTPPGVDVGRASCAADEPFFPFWLEPDGLVTRRVTLLP